MQTVKLQGKEFKLAFNFAAGIAYENFSGKSVLDLKQFADGRLQTILGLGYCMILANNDPAIVPEWEDFTRDLTFGQEATDLFNAINAEISSYFKPLNAPKIGAKKTKKGKNEEKPQEESEQKND